MGDRKDAMSLGISLNLFRSNTTQSAQGLRLASSSQSSLSGSLSKLSLSDSDAVRITLSREAKQSSQASSTEKLAEDPVVQAQPSQLRSLLSTLGNITKQISSFTQELSNQNLGEDKRAALSTEIANLNSEYKRVVESKEYRRIIEIGESVQSSISAGADSSKIAAALFSNIGLLGSDFLGLVQSGDLQRLGKVSGGFNSLANTNIAEKASSSEGANSVLGIINDINEALDGATLKAEQAGASAIPLINSKQGVPAIQQTVYSGDMEFALALRSYAPTDLLQAAVSGVELDPAGEIMLVANPKKDKDGNGKDDREELGKI